MNRNQILLHNVDDSKKNIRNTIGVSFLDTTYMTFVFRCWI